MDVGDASSGKYGYAMNLVPPVSLTAPLLSTTLTRDIGHSATCARQFAPTASVEETCATIPPHMRALSPSPGWKRSSRVKGLTDL